MRGKRDILAVMFFVATGLLVEFVQGAPPAGDSWTATPPVESRYCDEGQSGDQDLDSSAESGLSSSSAA